MHTAQYHALRASSRRWFAALCGLLLLAGCASAPSDRINMMPAPAVIAERASPPASAAVPFTGGSTAQLEMLYVTNRAPAAPDSDARHYDAERGYLLRAGKADIALGDDDLTWERAREISLLKNRPEEFPLQVERVRELGVVPDSLSLFTPREQLATFDPDGAESFLAEVEERLAASSRREIYVYVHGFKVGFENPLLVSSELWHFLGYNGAFVAFSWPATESALAYFKDSETARVSAWGLRKLIEYLARETSAERINILGYSAGSRVVLTALYELALIHQNRSAAEARDATRLGRVILVGSDVDTGTFASYLLDGLLSVSERLDIYVSPADGALRMANRLLMHRRLGEIQPGTIDARMRDYLSKSEELAVINVEGAENFDSGRGHSYFRSSPWVSSDILMTLAYGLDPAARGLERRDLSPIWHFPEDYLERFEAALDNAWEGNESLRAGSLP